MNADCPQAALLSQLIDDELSDGERSSLAAHISQCDVCTREMDNLKSLRSTLELLSADPLAKRRIRNALMNPKSVRSFAGKRLFVPLPIAAAIMLMLGTSVIGNVYWGFFRPVREQIVYKSITMPKGASDLVKETATVNTIVDSTAMQQKTADLQGMDSGIFRKKHNRINAALIEPEEEPFIAALQTDQYSAEFSTTTEYRLYSIPKIYSGGLNFSKQRRE
jgi:hypothetical protein